MSFKPLLLIGHIVVILVDAIAMSASSSSAVQPHTAKANPVQPSVFRTVVGHFNPLFAVGEAAQERRRAEACRALMAMVADGRRVVAGVGEGEGVMERAEVQMVEALVQGVADSVAVAWERPGQGRDRAGSLAGRVVRRLIEQHPAGAAVGAGMAGAVVERAALTAAAGRKRAREVLEADTAAKVAAKKWIDVETWTAMEAGGWNGWMRKEARAKADVAVAEYAGGVVEEMRRTVAAAESDISVDVVQVVSDVVQVDDDDDDDVEVVGAAAV